MAEKVDLSEEKLQALLNGEVASVKVFVQYIVDQKYGVVLEDGQVEETYKLQEDEWIDTEIRKIGDNGD